MRTAPSALLPGFSRAGGVTPRLIALGLCLQGLCAPIYAQAPPPAVSPDPDGKHSGAPLGQFTAGPFIITPTFRIGTLAVDTNVQYQRERTADFVASGGPGLDIALPFLDHWKLDIQGSSQYFYFHRTKELRRWTGGGTAALLWETTGTRASISTGLNRDFSRPNFEVDTRVATRQSNVSGSLERDLGRLTMVLRASLNITDVDQGQTFRGADLAKALTTNRYDVRPELRYRLTPLSSLLLEGMYGVTRLPNASSRSFSQESGGLGLLTTGFFKGQVTAGIRRNRLDSGAAVKSLPYLRGSLSQKLGRRLSLRENYSQESAVSAFAVDGSLPTFEHKSLTVELAILITSRIDMRFGGTRDRTLSDGVVQIVADDGSVVKAKRDDVAYIGRGDLGMRLGRARASIFASYTTRDSQFFSDFGIQGFQAGGRVEYAPR